MDKQTKQFYMIPDILFDMLPKNFGSICVYGIIQGLAAQEGYCYASNSFLAKKLHVSTRQIIYYIETLEKNGLIKVERRQGKTNKIYTTLPKTSETEFTPIPKTSETEFTPTPQTSEIEFTGGVKQISPKYINNNNNKNEGGRDSLGATCLPADNESKPLQKKQWANYDDVL